MEKANFSSIASLVGKDNSNQENLELPQENHEEPPKDLSFIKENEYYTGSNGTYRVGERFGKGGYGMVYHGTKVQTNEKVAIKIVPFKRWSDSQMKFVFDGFKGEDPLEHKRLVQVQTVKGVIKLLDFFQLKEGSVYIMQLPENCQTLLKYISDKHPMTEFDARNIFNQILQTLSDCHSKGVFHRDVKLENILVDKYDKVYLIDFGLALKVNEDGYSSREFAGTWTYFPPEKYNAEKYHPETATVWSVGIVLFEMLFNCKSPFNFQLPFTDSVFNIDQICNASVKFPSDLSRSLACQDLITKLLIKNPSQRYKFADALAHSWNKPAWNSGEILKIQSQKRTYSSLFANNAQEQIKLGSDGRSAGPDSKKQRYSQPPSSYTYNQTPTNNQAPKEYSQSYATPTYDHTTVYQPQASNIQALQAQYAQQVLNAQQAMFAQYYLRALQDLEHNQAPVAVATAHGWGARGAHAPPDFGRSENSNHSAGTPQYNSPPKIFRPSSIPAAPVVADLDLQSPPSIVRPWAL